MNIQMSRLQAAVHTLLGGQWFDEKGRARLIHPAAFDLLREAARNRGNGMQRARRSREEVARLQLAALQKRQRKATKLCDDACARDIGYYRVSAISNANRFSQWDKSLQH